MERYILFDKINTFVDWRLILTSLDVTPPEPKTNYVELDGMSGSLDLSEALTGEITYKDRTVSATFWTSEGNHKERERLMSKIIATLHGRKFKIVEPDDPDHYFYGRVKIKSQSNNLAYLEFSIEATCEPWRYALEDTTRIIDVNNQTVTAVINNNGVKTLCPTITVIGSAELTQEDVIVSLGEGIYRISDIKLRQGVNVIGISGTGSVIFSYKEATL